MREYPVYEEMKNSGSGWIRQMPKSWALIPLKYIFNIKKDIAGETGHTVLSVTQKGIVPKNMSSKGQFALDYSKYQRVNVGDFVMNHMDLLTGWVDISEYDGVTSPDYRVFVNVHPERFVSEYYKYIFQYCYTNRIFYGLGQGVAGFGRWRLPAEMFLNFSLPVPSCEEQTAIAAYLDDQCGKIDALIAETKESIEEYKKWKQSIIFEAVTRGLDPDVEMKDSGIEWISCIPAHWRTGKFAYENYIRARLGWRGLKADEYVDEGYPFLSAYNIVNNHLSWNKVNRITKFRYDESPEIKLSVGDILLVKDGAGIGKCARVDELPLGESTVNSSLAVITPKEATDYRYEYYYLQSSIFQNIILRLRNGMGVPHLTQEAMSSIYLPLPPLKEQTLISDYLDQKCGKIDELIYGKDILLDELEAYKHSLIYETVTGKRKVVAS